MQIKDKQIELTECEFVELFNYLPSIQVLEMSQLDIMVILILSHAYILYVF